MKFFNQALKKICGIAASAGGIVVLFVCLVVFVNVILRNLANTCIVGTNEIVQYGTMLAVCLTLAQVTLSDGHVKVLFFVEKFPKKFQKISASILDIISFAGFGLFFYSMIGTTSKSLSSKYVTSIFRIPMFIVDIIIMVGVGLMVIVLVFKMIERVVNFAKDGKPGDEENMTAGSGEGD